MTGIRSTLLLGGVRSGKSALAVSLGRRWPGPVTFVATALPVDGDMEARIDRHRRERPDEWTVVEAPELAAADLAERSDGFEPDGLVIVDCITVLVANLMFADLDDAAVLRRIDGIGAALAERPAVVVSNEVGMGVHPSTNLGRRYRDLLGAANRSVAARFDATYLVMAGRALRLDDSNGILQAMGVDR